MNRRTSTRSKAKRSLAILTAVSLSAVASAAGKAGVAVESFEMQIEGTSSLHDWVSEVTQLEVHGDLEIESGALRPGDEAFRVTIPVESIISPYKRMDRLTYEAFESEKYPMIEYKLHSLQNLENGELLASGTLSMAGSEQPLDMRLETELLAEGHARVTGSAPLVMTHFGMKPPSLMFGAIKVGDEVRVSFTLTINVNSTH